MATIDTRKLVGGPLNGHSHLAKAPADRLDLVVDRDGEPRYGAVYHRVTLTSGDNTFAIWRHDSLPAVDAILMALGAVEGVGR